MIETPEQLARQQIDAQLGARRSAAHCFTAVDCVDRDASRGFGQQQISDQEIDLISRQLDTLCRDVED